jgi:adhesin transport system outer membrane protein
MGWLALFPLCAQAQATTLYQTVQQALAFSPELQAVTHNLEAAQYDLKRTRGRYLPSLDLNLGYGLEQYSDQGTRQPSANPSDSDWDPKQEATLILRQNIYDGGETSNLVSMAKERLNSANFLIQDTAQAIALIAINAHLNVYRLRELVALAEKDYEFHHEILRSLSEMEKAGAGDVAAVTQTQARMARTLATLSSSKANLDKNIANYVRVVGMQPGPLTYTEGPVVMPYTLEEALIRAAFNNPELMVLDARISESEARVKFERSANWPKFNVELSSRYFDQLEGDTSWQMTNQAMLVLRWNLYNGGQDKAAEREALSRTAETRATRDGRLLELQEAIATAWSSYFSLQHQKEAYQAAVDYGQRTLEAYLMQFSVSKRSLLDVLDAEKEYFLSASQLVNVLTDKAIAAYQILALVGDLNLSILSEE